MGRSIQIKKPKGNEEEAFPAGFQKFDLVGRFGVSMLIPNRIPIPKIIAISKMFSKSMILLKIKNYVYYKNKLIKMQKNATFLSRAR